MTPVSASGSTSSQALWPYLVPPSSHGRDETCAVSAHRHRIRFADGSVVLDADSGLWNVNLGYGNTAIAEAVSEAAEHASYLGAFRFENVYARRAAQDLVRVAGETHYARALFSSGGGAANDAAMKLVRHYHALRGEPRRKLVVALRNSFHGLTFGGFALTGEDLGQRVYGVDQRLVRHVDANDPDMVAGLMKRCGAEVAAVVVEPVLGTGTVPLTENYLAKLLELRAEHGFLLVADEVATGFGRTGTFFASQTWPEQPDLLLTSKGLTNGTCPASAVLFTPAVAEAFERFDAVLAHAETQGGSSIPCAAISATVAEMERLDAVAAGQALALRLESAIGDLVATHSAVTGSTGLGCFRTLRISGPGGAVLEGAEVAALVEKIRHAGAVVHPGPGGIQLVPALTYSPEELAELFACVRAGLTAYGLPGPARGDLAGAVGVAGRTSADAVPTEVLALGRAS